MATVAAHRPEAAALPSAASLESCFDKGASLALAERLGVPVPRTAVIRSPEDLSHCEIGFPCVVKPACEVEVKGVFYAARRGRAAAASGATARRGQAGRSRRPRARAHRRRRRRLLRPFDRGQPKRVFMHRRLREYPATGGASAAARAYYHETLKEYGLRILSSLAWHGVAMVEFKLQEASDRLVLMEINPKFWGSVELALEAGVDFATRPGPRLSRRELEYSEDYDRQLQFYWPLDGDLLHLLGTWQPGKIREYFGPHARTNLGYSHTADALKALRTCWQLARP